MTHPLHMPGITNSGRPPLMRGRRFYYQSQSTAFDHISAARRCSGRGSMQWSIGGAVMRHCHIVLLHAAAAAVLLCLLMPENSSRPLSIQQSASVRFGRDRGLKSDTAVADVPNGPRVWLYSLIGTDFPGSIEKAALLWFASGSEACAPTVECWIMPASHMHYCMWRAITAAVQRCRRCTAAAALAAALHRPGIQAGTHDTRCPRKEQRCAPRTILVLPRSAWSSCHHRLAVLINPTTLSNNA